MRPNLKDLTFLHVEVVKLWHSISYLPSLSGVVSESFLKVSKPGELVALNLAV